MSAQVPDADRLWPRRTRPSLMVPRTPPTVGDDGWLAGEVEAGGGPEGPVPGLDEKAPNPFVTIAARTSAPLPRLLPQPDTCQRCAQPVRNQTPDGQASHQPGHRPEQHDRVYPFCSFPAHFILTSELAEILRPLSAWPPGATRAATPPAPLVALPTTGDSRSEEMTIGATGTCASAKAHQRVFGDLAGSCGGLTYLVLAVCYQGVSRFWSRMVAAA